MPPPAPRQARVGLFVAALGAACVAGPGLAAPSAASAQDVRVEGLAALVGGATPGVGTVPILRSDVTLRARILVAGQSTRLPVGRLPQSLLAATLDELIGEVLIAREADRLRAARPGEEDVTRERRRLEEQAGGAARLAALIRAVGATEPELDAIATRRAYVDAFLRANLDGSTVVSDGELQRVYETGAHPFGERPLDDVREVMRAWVARQALERDVRRWIEVLRSRSVVRVFAGWARSAIPAAPAPSAPEGTTAPESSAPESTEAARGPAASPEPAAEKGRGAALCH